MNKMSSRDQITTNTHQPPNHKLTLPAPERTPAEEAAARAKEQAEQDALPYKWTQTIGDVDISLTVPGNLKGRDLVVDIRKTSLSAGIKGQEPIIKVNCSLLSLQYLRKGTWS